MGDFPSDARTADAGRNRVVTLPDAFGHPDELAVQVRARGVDVRCYHPALDMVGHPAVGCPLRFSEIE